MNTNTTSRERDLYTEAPEKSEHARREYAAAVAKLAELGFSSYEKDPGATSLANALGAPLNLKNKMLPTLSQEYVGSDDMCEIFRLRIAALPSLPFFGLMLVPHDAKTPAPLCIAAHGHLGTPELMYGMHGKNGYSDLIRKLLSRGNAVFAPQLLLWNFGFNPAKPHYATAYDRTSLDAALKSHGGSITALEVFCILRSIDALEGVRALDMKNLGVCGMSYGAFLTMRAMAQDTRIRRGFFMSCFDGGLDPRFPEWRVRDGFVTPRDGEIAALCAPRPVLIEIGENDDIFPPAGALKEAETARRAYKELNAEDSFRLHIWHGAHLVNPDTPGVDFISGR